MADISAAQVKVLRDKTGAGMMDCKKVLVEAGGDLDKAVSLLRERGLSKARGKAGRATSDGAIVAAVSEDGRVGALVEVNCETDFVARTDDFVALCQQLANAVIEHDPADVDALLQHASNGAPLNDQVVAAIAKLGENIQVRRTTRLGSGDAGCVATYIHAGGKIGSLVQVAAPDPGKAEILTAVKNVCMHVAATSPLGVSRDEIPQDEVDREREVLSKQAAQEGKPANVVEKMVEGRLNKFFKEVVLLEQPLVMDPETTVEKATKAVGAEVKAFRRFQLGEEIAE